MTIRVLMPHAYIHLIECEYEHEDENECVMATMNNENQSERISNGFAFVPLTIIKDQIRKGFRIFYD